MTKKRQPIALADPRSEVSGRVFISALTCVNHDLIRPALKDYDLERIQPDQWYPQQLWLDCIHTVSQHDNAMFNLVSLGMAIAHASDLPPVFHTMPLEDVLRSVTVAYDMDHRGGDYGSVQAQYNQDKCLRYIVRTPYPDDFFYGATYGLTRRFARPGVRFTVRYDDSVLRRDKGGDYTVIEVTWY